MGNPVSGQFMHKSWQRAGFCVFSIQCPSPSKLCPCFLWRSGLSPLCHLAGTRHSRHCLTVLVEEPDPSSQGPPCMVVCPELNKHSGKWLTGTVHPSGLPAQAIPAGPPAFVFPGSLGLCPQLQSAISSVCPHHSSFKFPFIFAKPELHSLVYK